MPKGFKCFEEPKHWLSFDEIERVVRAFARLGVQRIRLTGGEPLLRKNLPELAARISTIPCMTDLSLSTNGTQLEYQARALRAAGITRLNVSLDSLDTARFAAITKRNALDRVLRGLIAARNEALTQSRSTWWRWQVLPMKKSMQWSPSALSSGLCFA
jgi:GTP 3',8-cyclase